MRSKRIGGERVADYVMGEVIGRLLVREGCWLWYAIEEVKGAMNGGKELVDESCWLYNWRSERYDRRTNQCGVVGWLHSLYVATT